MYVFRIYYIYCTYSVDYCINCRTDCAYDTSDIQAAGQVFIFKMPARSLPDAILTGVEEFQQFGASLSSGVFGSTEVLAITSLTRCKLNEFNNSDRKL